MTPARHQLGRAVVEAVEATGPLPAGEARERAGQIAAAVAELDARSDALASRAEPPAHPAQVIRLAS